MIDCIENLIRSQIEDSIGAKKAILSDATAISLIRNMATIITGAYRTGHSLLLCGNGGSAADAQHIAAELVARFKLKRTALPALALNTNSSIVTAIGNDYEYNDVFERQVEAFGKSGDVLLAISTSGNSESIRRAIIRAKEQDIRTIALLGKDGGFCRLLAETALVVPSTDTPRIQETHIMIGHILCDIIEQSLFGDLT